MKKVSKLAIAVAAVGLTLPAGASAEWDLKNGKPISVCAKASPVHWNFFNYIPCFSGFFSRG
jgi:hypothetical protein